MAKSNHVNKAIASKQQEMTVPPYMMMIILPGTCGAASGPGILCPVLEHLVTRQRNKSDSLAEAKKFWDWST